MKKRKLDRQSRKNYTMPAFAHDKLRSFSERIQVKKTFFIFLLLFSFYFPIAQAKNKNKTKGPIVYKLLTEGSQLAIENKHEEALEKFQRAERLRPGYGITLYLIGKCYNAMKQYKKGLDYSKRSEKTGKFPSDLYLNIAISYARLQQWEQSRKYTQIFLAKEKDPEMILTGKMMLEKVNKQIKMRDEAQAEQDAGIREYQKEDYLQALLHFQKADKIASQNGHLHYLMGLCLNGLGQYQKALSHFQQSKDLGYTPKDLTFQIATAKANLGKYREAKGDFETYAKEGDHSQIKKDARKYAKKIQDYEKKNSPLQIYALFGTAYDSNVLSVGEDVQLPTAISNKGDWNVFLGAGGEYRILGNPKKYVSLKGNYFSTYQMDLEDFNIQNLTGSLKGGFLLQQKLFTSLEIGYNYLFVGGDSYQSQFQTSSRLAYRIKPWTSLELNYQYTYLVDFLAQIPREIDRTGNIHTIGLIEYFSFDRLGLRGKVSYHYGETHSVGSDYDYNSHALALWIGQDLPYDMDVTIGIQYHYRDFSQPNFRAGGPFTRQESFWMYSLSWSKKWNRGISSFISYSFLDSKSNLGVYRYQKNRVMIGIRWDG